ncbi:MAG: hypothetical protein AAF658_22400, partial [Myxococcota bacterium]
MRPPQPVHAALTSPRERARFFEGLAEFWEGAAAALRTPEYRSVWNAIEGRDAASCFDNVIDRMEAGQPIGAPDSSQLERLRRELEARGDGNAPRHVPDTFHGFSPEARGRVLRRIDDATRIVGLGEDHALGGVEALFRELDQDLRKRDGRGFDAIVVEHDCRCQPALDRALGCFQRTRDEARLRRDLRALFNRGSRLQDGSIPHGIIRLNASDALRTGTEA